MNPHQNPVRPAFRIRHHPNTARAHRDSALGIRRPHRNLCHHLPRPQIHPHQGVIPAARHPQTSKPRRQPRARLRHRHFAVHLIRSSIQPHHPVSFTLRHPNRVRGHRHPVRMPAHPKRRHRPQIRHRPPHPAIPHSSSLRNRRRRGSLPSNTPPAQPHHSNQNHTRNPSHQSSSRTCETPSSGCCFSERYPLSAIRCLSERYPLSAIRCLSERYPLSAVFLLPIPYSLFPVFPVKHPPLTQSNFW